MPSKSVWTEGQDSQIRRLRLERASWDIIAAALGLTRWAVIERARRLGLTRRLAQAAEAAIDLDRPPHPAGHPDSWNAINQGTCLRGVAFHPPGAIR